ncbi:family 43 glycosylhydrolase [Stakelama marina]|uniref:Family 43 glycosylhydrolase n=1 Tax=Stakelama marina TaxID=2826939 RepID=A0A8T4I9U3_9SPHN|nr:family 43 glycosylhydrolase [Stakelama marina]MBR0550902.1 family 43 glycosylhydrolase [Stakelama marina]
MFDRRTGLKAVAAAGLLGTVPKIALGQGARASSSLDPYAGMKWGEGFESQRKADLGNGAFLNPIFAGDHPDPTILRDGDDYYLTFSSFDAYPGIVIWHSRDLVNWRPVTAALTTPIGSVWAPELVKHGGRYFVYIPARTPTKKSIYVIHAKNIDGPWSEPIDLGLPDHIDPGHAVAEDGTRYLFLSGGDRVKLTPDGLRTAGPVEHVYDPWHYPKDWVVETFAPEGPKITRRGDYYYMTLAVGGTAGPPTGHMVIMARSRTLDGPWENDPENPVVHTKSVTEKWWSRGHATPFEGPGGQWWMVYHGYENGYWTLGRQALLQPFEWSADGWARPVGGDLSTPLEKPLDLGELPTGMPLSDDFSTDKFGIQWSFYDPGPDEKARVQRANGVMRVRGKGATPSDCSPITCICGDHAYRIEVDVGIDPGAEGGLLLYYNRRLYAGLGLNAKGLMMHRYGLQRQTGKPPEIGRRMRVAIENDRNIVTMYTSADSGRNWDKFDVQMEVSGYNHNTAYDFLSLRPALYSAGDGEVRFSNFTYRALS